MQHPEIADEPAFTVVGLHTTFIHIFSPDVNSGEIIPRLWERFAPRMSEVPDRVGREAYGVIYGKPLSERAHPDELHYVAGVRVSSANEVPAGMVAHTVPASTFARSVHRGKLDRLAETLGHAYRDWLPRSGYEHADVADVEVYGERFDPLSDASEMEYWISIRRRS